MILMDKTSQLIALIKNGDQTAIRQLYEDNKNGFLLFVKRYNVANEDIIDIYQDAIVAFIENAKKGKIDNLQSSATTYLFGIGKFMVFQKIKKAGKTLPSEDLENVVQAYDDYNEDENIEQVSQLQIAFKKLGDQCQKVLQLFYYEEKKLDEIQDILGYTNKDVLKSQKSRCLKQLKEIATQTTHKTTR
jgi:RNA polymerase sigma factor (sigma-70 family)